MLVLHASIITGRLFLWGETSSLTISDSAPNSPYAAPATTLQSALRATTNTPDAPILSSKSKKNNTPENAHIVLLSLPSDKTGPIPSSGLVDDRPTSGDTNLRSWQHPALGLTPAQTIDLLAACTNRQTFADGVAVGRSLSFLSDSLRFAAGLVARQRFLPALDQTDGQYRAHWQPVLTGLDEERLCNLAKSMPPACRAASLPSPPENKPLSKRTKKFAAPSSTSATPADCPPAATILRDFLNTLVDELIRQAASSAPREYTGRGIPQSSVHDRWLNALRSPTGLLQADAQDLSNLAVQVRDWKQRITATAAGPLRLCFRLEEPPPETGEDGKPLAPTPNRSTKLHDDWYVRYLVQPISDPSLQIPLDAIWTSKSKSKLLATTVDPKHFALGALGQAASLAPPIEQSLKKPAPAGFALNASGAHEFLTTTAWLLEQSDFKVFLPAWWTGKGTKARLSIRAKVKSPTMQSTTGLSLDQIVNFDWQVALGDEQLTLADLQRLADLKSPLVRMRGQWVELNPDELAAAIALWKKKQSGSASLRQLVEMSLGKNEEAAQLNFGGVDSEGWVGDFLSRLQGQSGFEQLPPPPGLRGTLRPYQLRGYSWLNFLQQWGLGACLADDMGLGKTLQTLALLEKLWAQPTIGGQSKRPSLLICPTSVTGNWQKEAQRFTPNLPVMVHHGTDRKKDASFIDQASRHALVITSYPLLFRDIDLIKQCNWSGVILDEAQNIKNPHAKQAQAARAVASAAGYRIALTGTPVENHIGDLWSVMEFLNPGLLGSQSDFKKRFFVPIQTNGNRQAAQQLKSLTGPFILRRLKTDKSIIADLPDKLEMKVFCTLTKEQASLYEAVVREGLKAIDSTDGISRKGAVLAMLSKLKQVSNHPAQFLGDNSELPNRSGKLARLTEMLEEALAEGDRALIFSQFSEMGAIIKRHLQETFGREVLFLHGATPKKQRDQMVERFQSPDPSAPGVFVLSLKAGGTGLNLTAASHVFHYDRWWNPAVENQATDRAFRIGQKKNVQVHKFLVAGTLDERIDEMIERKKGVANAVISAGESWLTELTTTQLRDLVQLRQ